MKLSGIDRRMIYAYFENKENMFEGVLTESVSRLVGAASFSGRGLEEYTDNLFDLLYEARRRPGSPCGELSSTTNRCKRKGTPARKISN